MPNDADNPIACKKSILMNLFPKSSSSISLNIPQTNFIALQVSAEPFCVSEQSSLSGQCGSKYSNDFGFPRSTCTVAIAASVAELKLSYASQDEHKALKDLTVSLLRRHSVFKSKNNQLLLKEIHDLTDSSDGGLTGSIDNIDVQLQRLDCETLADDSSFITAVPNAKTMVPFLVYRGDDVDVDDLSWLEQKLGEPVGKIMLECGVKKIKINALFDEKLNQTSTRKRRNTIFSPGKRTRSRSEAAQSEKQQATQPDVKVTVQDEEQKSEDKTIRKDTVEKTKETMAEGLMNVDDDTDGLIASDDSPSASCPLLKDEQTSFQHVVLEIHESDSEKASDKSHGSRTSKKTEKVAKKGVLPEEGFSSLLQIGSASFTDVNQKVSDSIEYALTTKTQAEMKIRSVWFNLAHPTRLKVLQEGNDHCVNLVTSIVPSICCWIPVYVDLLRSSDVTINCYKRHRYSLLAYVMGQALPDKGRLLIKVFADFLFCYGVYR